MARKTIADPEERIGELEVDLQITEYERDDWQRTAAHRAELLEVATSERDFLRAIVHGLVPASLR